MNDAANKGVAQSAAAHQSRSSVPRHDKLLLIGVLLIVAGWIIFRVVASLATAPFS